MRQLILNHYYTEDVFRRFESVINIDVCFVVLTLSVAISLPKAMPAPRLYYASG